MHKVQSVPETHEEPKKPAVEGRDVVIEQRKRRKCLKCLKLFDSPSAGIRRCGRCKINEPRPPTIPIYYETPAVNAARSTRRPSKWR